MEKLFEKSILKNRIILLIIIDIFIIQIASFVGLFLRFDFSIELIPDRYLNWAVNYTVFNTILTIIIFVLCKLYRSVWHYII